MYGFVIAPGHWAGTRTCSRTSGGKEGGGQIYHWFWNFDDFNFFKLTGPSF